MEENSQIPPVGSVLDEDLEQEIRRWEALPPEVQRERLAKVTESFGVGGP